MKLSEKTQATADEIRTLALQSKQCLVTVHQDPDADAIGSAIAWAHLLRQFGCNVTVWAEDPLDDYLLCLPGAETVSQHIDMSVNYDSIWVLDNTSIERIRGFELLVPMLSAVPVVNIDHHRDNTMFGTYNIVEDISSVGELVTWIARRWNIPLPPGIAACLYAAIACDTGRFLYSNTTASTFEAASFLIAQGVDPSEWGTRLFESLPAQAMVTLNSALHNLVIDFEHRFAYTTLPLGAGPDLVKPIDFIRQIKEADVFAVFREEADHSVRINLRSKGPVIVSRVAHQFGGGGHPKAAGIRLSGPLDYAVARVVAAVLDEINDVANH